MKKFLPILLVIILLVMMLSSITAFAGCSINGSSSVQAGKSYTYTGSASYTGASLLGTLEGLGQADYLSVDASSLENKSISDSASITVSIPSNAKSGDTYTIKLSGQYSVYDEDGNPQTKHFSTSKTITVATAPVATQKPKTTKNPNATPRPTDPPTVWELTANDVAAMAEGGSVAVTDPADTLLPIEVLSDLAEKNGTITIDFGTYKCTIDAAAISAIPKDLDELDLGLSMDIDEALSDAAGGQDVYQLHFNHEGQFPCPISFTFKAENSSPDDVVYLYYYYGTANVIEGQASAVVDKDGYVTFSIYHCSSYFVSDAVIEGSVNSFDSDAEIQTLTEDLEETQTALQEAQTENDTLKTQLEEAQKEALSKETQDTDVQTTSAAASGPLDIALPALIAAGAGVALIAVLLTMAICHVGIFRKRQYATIKAPEDEPEDFE